MDILFDHEDQVELLGFTPEVIQRYSHDMYKIRKAIAEGGRYLLAEIILMYWAERYFKHPIGSFKIGHRTNKGMDIISPDGKIRIEVKTTHTLDNNKYASFQSIDCKRDKNGEYIFTHLLFYSPHLSLDSVYLFTADKIEELVIPQGGKLNIKPTLDEAKYIDTKDSSINRWSVAFQENKKYLI
jgi:hypothetical protein